MLLPLALPVPDGEAATVALAVPVGLNDGVVDEETLCVGTALILGVLVDVGDRLVLEVDDVEGVGALLRLALSVGVGLSVLEGLPLELGLRGTGPHMIATPNAGRPGADGFTRHAPVTLPQRSLPLPHRLTGSQVGVVQML